MKNFFAAIVTLAFSVSLLPSAYAEQQSVGLSYAQVTQYLSKSIVMHESSSVRGQTRYLGMTNDKMAIMEIIGQKNDISQATFVICLPKDSQTIVMRNGAMLLRFMANIAPEWSGSVNWASDALGKITLPSNNSVSTIRGTKKIVMTFQKPLGMIVLTVKHR